MPKELPPVNNHPPFELSIREKHYSKYIPVFIFLILLAAFAGFASQTYLKHEAKNKKYITVKGPKTAQVINSPYTGLRTYCNETILACIHYPATWKAGVGFSGMFTDPGETTDVALIPWANQNLTPNEAYIYSVTSLPNSVTQLYIVGYIVSDQPAYVVMNGSYVMSQHISSGETEYIVDGNSDFMGKKGTISLIAAPYSTGYAAINDFDQAKAWFLSADGLQDLKILQSFYYE